MMANKVEELALLRPFVEPIHNNQNQRRLATNYNDTLNEKANLGEIANLYRRWKTMATKLQR